MPFMTAVVTEPTKWLAIETTSGTWWVETDIAGDDRSPETVLAYTEATDPDDIIEVAEVDGVGHQLSADGYMDCTDWCVHDTEKEAIEHLRESDCECMDTLGETDCSVCCVIGCDDSCPELIPTEPDELDYVTTDHKTFYEQGTNRVLLVIDENDDHVAFVRAHMDAQQFWPNAWFISDHGNAHLIDLTLPTDKKSGDK